MADADSGRVRAVEHYKVLCYPARFSAVELGMAETSIMKRCLYGAAALVALSTIACGSSTPGAQAPGAAGAAGNGMAGSETTAGSGASEAGRAGSSSGDSGGAPTTAPGRLPSAMPIISHGVPAFASSTNPAAKPGDGNDGKPNSAWTSTAIPAWLAYDLSSVPAAQRGRVLVAWYCATTPDYFNPSPGPVGALPLDYTLEINTASGGGQPPADGWTVVQTVVGNDRSSRQRLVELDGANWVRINVTRSSDPSSTRIDLDVHSAPEGATDSWLFMGDSITYMTTTYAFSDLPQQVNALDAARWPAIIPAALGGTNTNTAKEIIDSSMTNFPGRFVVLAYGTNDHAGEYKMEELVQHVIAAGKVPVVPHMPWSATPGIQTDGPLINAQIDALYVKYPEILPGPDLWAFYTNRTDLISATDVHPNEQGQAELRKLWAHMMTGK